MSEEVSPASAPTPKPLSLVEAKRQFEKYLDLGAYDPAIALYQDQVSAGRPLKLEPAHLSPLVAHLQTEKRWEELSPIMTELIDLEQQRVNNLRITLAQVCVKKLDRPEQAIDLLAPIDHRYLSATQRDVAIEMQGRARRMQSEQQASPGLGVVLPNENSPESETRG
ncbi:hypothetical protein MalM25_00910 [Planctomycetes bacterium MalM25]|nr:hypothetical protein MalM25_00910 [Planctomycetes bacterium MalM25]